MSSRPGRDIYPVSNKQMREGVKKRVREKGKESEGGGERKREKGEYVAGSQDFYVRILNLETILPMTESIIKFVVDI